MLAQVVIRGLFAEHGGMAKYVYSLQFWRFGIFGFNVEAKFVSFGQNAKTSFAKGYSVKSREHVLLAFSVVRAGGTFGVRSVELLREAGQRSRRRS